MHISIIYSFMAFFYNNYYSTRLSITGTPNSRHNYVHAEHKIRVFGQAKLVINFVRTKACMVGHTSVQSELNHYNYRNELMSARTALKTDQIVHCSNTQPTMLLFLFCALP